MGRIKIDQLNLETKSAYGREIIYPACAKSKKLLTLMGKDRRAFSANDVSIIRQIGYKVVLKNLDDTVTELPANDDLFS